MSELNLTEISAASILTPGTEVLSAFADTTHKTLKTKDDLGRVRGTVNNYLTSAAQAFTATVRAYMTGSQIAVPKTKLQVGTLIRWRFAATKTAAGSASSTIDIAIGTAGTTADTARVSFTKPAGSAAADEAWFEVDAIVKSIGAAGTMLGTMRMVHNLQNTGHAVIPAVVVTTLSAGFDMTVEDLFVGLCLTTGASDVVTVQQMFAESHNL